MVVHGRSSMDIGGVICLVNSVNKRDLDLLNRSTNPDLVEAAWRDFGRAA